MNLNKKEINFINECIDLYWEDYNPNHEDNIKNKMISDNLVKKLTIPVVSERKIVRCEDPMVCLRGCSVHEQTCKHPIYER